LFVSVAQQSKVHVWRMHMHPRTHARSNADEFSRHLHGLLAKLLFGGSADVVGVSDGRMYQRSRAHRGSEQFRFVVCSMCV
jgi:hypothetical protein